MARPRQQERSRKCYCSLHVRPGVQIPISRWIQHQDRRRAQALLELSPNHQTPATEEDPQPAVLQDCDPIDYNSGTSDEYKTDVVDCDDGTDGSDTDLEGGQQVAEQFGTLETPEQAEHENSSKRLTIQTGNPATEDLRQEDERLDDCSPTFTQPELEDASSWILDSSRFENAMRWLLGKIEHNVSDVAFNNRPDRTQGDLLLYQVKARLQQLIRFTSCRIPCCFNVCLLFYRDHPDICPVCEEPTKETVIIKGQIVVRPQKLYLYFSPIDRLLLMFAHCATSQAIQEYVAVIRNPLQNPTASTRDFYDSAMFEKLAHLFDDYRTVPIFFSTDGYTTTRQANSSFWPQIITVGNKPPDICYQELLLIGLIPGEPANLASFMDPFFDDLEHL